MPLSVESEGVVPVIAELVLFHVSPCVSPCDHPHPGPLVLATLTPSQRGTRIRTAMANSGPKRARKICKSDFVYDKVSWSLGIS